MHYQRLTSVPGFSGLASLMSVTESSLSPDTLHVSSPFPREKIFEAWLVQQYNVYGILQKCCGKWLRKNTKRRWKKTVEVWQISTRLETDETISGTGAMCGRGGCHWILFKNDCRALCWQLVLSWFVLRFSASNVILNNAASLETVIQPTSIPFSYNGLLVTIAIKVSPDLFFKGNWPDHDCPLVNLSMILCRAT